MVATAEKRGGDRMKHAKKPWMGKQLCEATGNVWIPSYHKQDGTLVRGFCRRR